MICLGCILVVCKSQVPNLMWSFILYIAGDNLQRAAFSSTKNNLIKSNKKILEDNAAIMVQTGLKADSIKLALHNLNFPYKHMSALINISYCQMLNHAKR